MIPDLTISAAAMRIVKLLVGNQPRTVADLIEATGVTRTAVTEQLNELVAAGLVKKSTERLSGRGRPRHLYTATTRALTLLFAGAHRVVVPAMWDAIEEAGGPKLVQHVVRRVGRAMAQHYASRIRSKTPRARLRELIRLVEEEGGVAELVEQQGHVVFHNRSCSFISMLDEHRQVCAVDQEMISAVVGRPVRRTACRLEGAPCCTFEIVEATS